MAKASAGRYGVLLDVAGDLSDEDDFETVGKHSKSSGVDGGTKGTGKTASKNAKKRAKKRAAKGETSSAFVAANGSSSAERRGGREDWRSWQTRDKIVVEDQFEKDLQEAILQSKLEEEKRQLELEEIDRYEAMLLEEPQDKKQYQKKGKVKMSLQEWHASLEEIEAPHEIKQPSDVVQEEEKATPVSDTSFFDRVSLEVAAEMDREQLTRAVKISQETKAEEAESKAEAARLAYESDTLEKKDRVICDLSSQVQALQTELKEVKLRNKQLCHILSKGEMKEKSELVQQYEDLVQVKDELTAQISELHASLEQERSKVKTLKSELLKYNQRHSSASAQA